MQSEYIYYYLSSIGVLELHTTDSYLTQLVFCAEMGVSSLYIPEVMRTCITQLDEYFGGIRRSFDLPLYIKGTIFQESVWRELLMIPYGQTISYKQLAERVGNPKACRAVGSANGKNPLALFIPCHRVISADGSLGGYAGGLRIKSELLQLERSNLTVE